MTQKNIRFSENTVMRVDESQMMVADEASSVVMPEKVLKQMEKYIDQKHIEEVQSNKSIFANLKPLENLHEEDNEYFDNRVFTPYNNNPK